MDGGAPLNTDQFIERLQQLHEVLPRRLRQCADYAARHQARLAQATVADFARGAGVPASAVVRFSQVMGFSGYAEMRNLFRGPFVLPRPGYAERLADLRQRGQGQASGLLADFIDAARQSLEMLADSVDTQVFDLAARKLGQAGLIHTIGLGRCFAIAAQVAYGWDRMEVPQVLHGATRDLPALHAIRPGDAVLLVVVSPLNAELLEFLKTLCRSDASIVAICDPGVAMHLRQCALCLVLAEAEAAGFRPLSSAMTLSTALATAVAAARAASPREIAS